MTDTFTHIENEELRTWNRCAMIFNLMKDDVKAAAKYAGSFAESERTKISEMFNRIKVEGYDVLHAAISREVQKLPREGEPNNDKGTTDC